MCACDRKPLSSENEWPTTTCENPSGQGPGRGLLIVLPAAGFACWELGTHSPLLNIACELGIKPSWSCADFTACFQVTWMWGGLRNKHFFFFGILIPLKTEDSSLSHEPISTPKCPSSEGFLQLLYFCFLVDYWFSHLVTAWSLCGTRPQTQCKS